MENEYLGYSLRRIKEKNKSVIPPTGIEGSILEFERESSDGGVAVPYFRNENINFYGLLGNEFDLIKKYREIALMPEAEEAINDIINECIIIEDDGTSPLFLNLDEVDLPEYIKYKIQEEFEYLLNLLNFKVDGAEIFRKWYVDGRLFYYKIIDKEYPFDGIKELRYVDPLNIKKVIKITETYEDTENLTYPLPEYFIKEEYYIFSPTGFLSNEGIYTNNTEVGIKIYGDSVTFVHSGLYDPISNHIVSYLHKAIKPANQLRMLEDAVVINKLARSPQRRVFYVDVGNMPRHKQEEYLDNIMNRYRNQITYNQATGELHDTRRFMSMLEDYWIPTSNGRGTKIENLSSDDNFDNMTSVEYFQKKLYKALNLPTSRLSNETEFSVGRTSEILRDELKFYRFVVSLRNKFSELFNDFLRTQLSLKGIISSDEWDSIIKNKIKYIYNRENYFSELKTLEIIKERLDVADAMDSYVGTYFSRRYIKKNIFKFSDEEIEKLYQEIANERNSNEIPESLGTDFSRFKKEEPQEATSNLGTDLFGGGNNQGSLGGELGSGLDSLFSETGGTEEKGSELNQGEINLSDIL